MMKPVVLLIAPPVYDFALFDLFLKPYSLLSLGRSFEKSGYQVHCINSLDYTETVSRKNLGTPRRHPDGTGKFFRQEAEKPSLFSHIQRQYARYGIMSQVLEQKIKLINPDLVLVSTGMTYWYPGVQEVVRLVRKHHGSVPVITGGVYATLCPDHCRRTIDVDYIIKGSAFPGIVPVLKKLSLPVPCVNTDTDLLILPDMYSGAGKKFNTPATGKKFETTAAGKKFETTAAGVIRLNKGCPFRCRYCASAAVTGNFTKGNPRDSFFLVEKIQRQLGTEVFAFYDDALLFSRDEVFVPFLRMVLDAGLHLSFYLPNGIHLDYLDFNTARLMKQAGFREIRIGLESADEEFHHTMDKKLEVETLGEKIDLLSRAGFQPWEIGLYILAGLPGQRKDEVTESVHFVSRFGVRIYIAEYSPVPLSPLWEKSIELSHYPLETEPLTHNNTILPMEWEHFTRTDLENIKILARSLSPLKKR